MTALINLSKNYLFRFHTVHLFDRQGTICVFSLVFWSVNLKLRCTKDKFCNITTGTSISGNNMLRISIFLMSNIALHFIFVIIYLNENQVFHFFTAAVFFFMESVQKDVEKTPKCCNECNNRQIDVRLTTVFV